MQLYFKGDFGGDHFVFIYEELHGFCDVESHWETYGHHVDRLDILGTPGKIKLVSLDLV